MKLGEEEARRRLRAEVHGVLCTMHPTRGPDPQPVVYAITDDGYLGVPIDKVKPKSSSRLKREDNREADPRGTLHIEHWEPEDWSRLWWVRTELRHVPDPAPDVVSRLVGRRHRSGPLDSLTKRESEVLALIAEGLSNAGVAQALVVTISAVERHVSSIFDKLGLHQSPEQHRRVLAVLNYLRS